MRKTEHSSMIRWHSRLTFILSRILKKTTTKKQTKKPCYIFVMLRHSTDIYLRKIYIYIYTSYLQKGRQWYLKQAPAVCLPLHPQPVPRKWARLEDKYRYSKSPHMHAAAVPDSTRCPLLCQAHIRYARLYRLQAAISSTITELVLTRRYTPFLYWHVTNEAADKHPDRAVI